MDGSNSNIPEHINGINKPDLLLPENTTLGYHGKVMIFRPYMDDEIVEMDL